MLSKKEYQEEVEKTSKPKDKKITLKLTYRDEICSHCKKQFRAGESCDGYMDYNIIGFSGVGVGRHGYFCNACMEEFIYRFIGESSLLDFNRAPHKYYPFLGKSRKPKPVGMMIKGKYLKYNKKIFEAEVNRFVKWVKKNEPWNIVDYKEFSGL